MKLQLGKEYTCTVDGNKEIWVVYATFTARQADEVFTPTFLAYSTNVGGATVRRVWKEFNEDGYCLTAPAVRKLEEPKRTYWGVVCNLLRGGNEIGPYSYVSTLSGHRFPSEEDAKHYVETVRDTKVIATFSYEM